MTDSPEPAVTGDHLAGPPTSKAAGSSYFGSFFEKTDWWSFRLTSTLLLVVYLWTLAPEVTLENSGMQATGAFYAGVPDNPGFPVWTTYSWFFTRLLPFSTIAWRVAVGSAVAAALACGLVALMVSRGGKLVFEENPTFSTWSQRDQNRVRIVCGCIAGLALGLSVPVWQKAVIVDIWTFGVLLFTTVLCLLMRWMAAPDKRQYLYRACLLFGMLLTGNWELVVTIPALLLVVVIGDQKLGRDLLFTAAAVTLGVCLCIKFGALQSDSHFGLSRQLEWFFVVAFTPAVVAALVTIITTRRAGSEWKPAMKCTIRFYVGLACFFYLPIASMMNPPMNWGYPRTVEGFYHVVSRGQYEMIWPTAEITRFLGQLWAVGKDTCAAFGWYYLLFALLPFCFLLRLHHDTRKWMLTLGATFAYAGPFLIAMLNPFAGKQSVDLLRPYWSAMYVILAIWAGLGMIIFAGMVATPAPAKA